MSYIYSSTDTTTPLPPPTAAFYKGNGTYDNGVQTCLALALWANAAPTPELHATIGGNLLADLVEGAFVRPFVQWDCLLLCPYPSP